MDLFSTDTLVGIVQDLRSRVSAQPTLLSMFFPALIEEASEEIHFDTEDKPRRIAPFVNPLLEGKLVESLGHGTKTFKPAYIKDKRVFDSSRPLRRMMGEALTGNMTPSARQAQLLALELADQLQMVRKRKEVMAGEAMALGQVTVDGEGFPTVVVNFGRDAGQTLDISGGAQEWTVGGSKDPLGNIETWSELMLKNSGAAPTDIVMTPTPWSAFRADAKFEKAVDLRRAGADNVVSMVAPVNVGLQYVGQMGQRRIWTYYDWYVNDAGSEVPVLADGTVLLASGSMEGVQVHGAIRDEEAGFQATEFWTKTWVQQDPSVRYLLGQSAPLVVPFRANASMGVTVT